MKHVFLPVSEKENEERQMMPVIQTRFLSSALLNLWF